MDLVVLTALACRAPVAVLSVRGADGSWKTLSSGLQATDGLDDDRLYEVVSSAGGLKEFADMLAIWPKCGFVAPPNSLRWAYAIPVRGRNGALLGVLAVMDRVIRTATLREERALLAAGRQLAQHLTTIKPATMKVDAAPLSASYAPIVVGSRSPTGPVPHLLRSREVAAIFEVTDRTVANWAESGRLPSLRTLGGHLRFREDEIAALADSLRHRPEDAVMGGEPR